MWSKAIKRFAVALLTENLCSFFCLQPFTTSSHKLLCSFSITSSFGRVSTLETSDIFVVFIIFLFLFFRIETNDCFSDYCQKMLRHSCRLSTPLQLVWLARSLDWSIEDREGFLSRLMIKDTALISLKTGNFFTRVGIFGLIFLSLG